ncbi:hypothetical protein [Acinetobacter sp.]|uniref:hypothetical protein n=1 Tax=Acinetobacter sp. TaxID=472 RepID=UPI0037506F1D
MNVYGDVAAVSSVRTPKITTLTGNILLQTFNTTGFGKLLFGGTTNAFPALVRNGSTITLRFADNSNYAHLEVGNLTVHGTTTGISGGGGTLSIGADVEGGVANQVLFVDNNGKLAEDVGFRYDLNASGTLYAPFFDGNGQSITGLMAANLSGTLPALDGSALTGIVASAIALDSSITGYTAPGVLFVNSSGALAVDTGVTFSSGIISAVSFTGSGDNLTGFAAVARSGNYNDLSGLPDLSAYLQTAANYASNASNSAIEAAGSAGGAGSAATDALNSAGSAATSASNAANEVATAINALATVASTGSYADLINIPTAFSPGITVPVVNALLVNSILYVDSTGNLQQDAAIHVVDGVLSGFSAKIVESNNTTQTIGVADSGTAINFTSSSTVTITCDPDARVGTSVTLIQGFTGALQIASSGAGTVVNRQSKFNSAGQYAVVNATVIAIASNTTAVWLISGDLA